ncbi:MAG: cell wall-active antibiotics response protein, partial [Clostridiales bacterium]|nr:cell wall-active antibiotics response protein [Clostridiales bacterium]
MANRVLTDNVSTPLPDVAKARVAINARAGNLMIDRLVGDERLLAAGTLQYLQKQGPPTQTLDVADGRAHLTLEGRGGARSWLRLPWAACNAAFGWDLYLNAAVPSDIDARSGGGNITLDLSEMSVTRVAADTGGGNINVVLPDEAADLVAAFKTGAGDVTLRLGSGLTGANTIEANSGAGNVAVTVPRGLAARIQAASGLGKVIVESTFTQVDRGTYESPDYDGATDRVEITIKSGAGNVTVVTR